MRLAPDIDGFCELRHETAVSSPRLAAQ